MIFKDLQGIAGKGLGKFHNHSTYKTTEMNSLCDKVKLSGSKPLLFVSSVIIQETGIIMSSFPLIRV